MSSGEKRDYKKKSSNKKRCQHLSEQKKENKRRSIQRPYLS